MLVFDIETGPIAEDQLRELFAADFQPPPHPGEFDPASVKTGNLKDKAKIEEKIAECREAHKKAVANYEASVESSRVAWFAELVGKAALSPLTGRVLAIGYLSTESRKAGIDDGGGDESLLLEKFWKKYIDCRPKQRKLGGWNIEGFDLPFLIKRSWLHGVEVPGTIRDANDRYWDATFVDLMKRFSAGKWNDHTKLDAAGKFFGCGGKPDDCDGASFARLWFGTAEEKAKAVAYLENDLKMTASVAERLGVG